MVYSPPPGGGGGGIPQNTLTGMCLDKWGLVFRTCRSFKLPAARKGS